MDELIFLSCKDANLHKIRINQSKLFHFARNTFCELISQNILKYVHIQVTPSSFANSISSIIICRLSIPRNAAISTTIYILINAYDECKRLLSLYNFFGINSIPIEKWKRFLSKWSLVMRLFFGREPVQFIIIFFIFSFFPLLLKYYGTFICVSLLIHYLLPFGIRLFFVYPSVLLLFSLEVH